MNWDFWKGFLVGLFIGAAIALAVAGMYAWVAIGAIPLVGGIAQGIIKKKAKKAIGIENPPPKTFLKYGKHSTR